MPAAYRGAEALAAVHDYDMLYAAPLLPPRGQHALADGRLVRRTLLVRAMVAGESLIGSDYDV